MSAVGPDKDEAGLASGLRSLTYEEQIALNSYKGAAESAVSDATSFGDKVVTAAVSAGTAYGAVIALVKPKDSVSTVAVAAPFVALALAVAFALWAQAVGLHLDSSNDIGNIRTKVESTISRKRFLGRLGLLALVTGLVWAGVAVHDNYGKPAEDTSVRGRIYLTSSGRRLVGRICRDPTPGLTVVGNVKDAAALGAKRVAVKVDAGNCVAGAGTLVLPPTAILAARLTR